jgi:Cytochrome c3
MPYPSSVRRTILFVWLAGIAVCGLAPNRPSRDELLVQTPDAPAAKPEPPPQPLPYSHKKHIALGLQCQDCHPNPEPGDRMTFPATSKCMACHSSIAKDKPSIQKLAAFAKSGTAIPWIRVYSLPSWVYWNHRSHLEAQMTCEMCHSKVEELDTMAKITNVTTMAGCVDCHKENDAGIGCKYCHADK